jgi:trehalose-6-phosphate synthase
MTEPDREAMRQRCEALQVEFFANRALIIAANRGPVTFEKAENGTFPFERGGGGLVTALTGLCRHTDATWIGCTRTEADAEWKHGRVILDDGTTMGVHLISPDETAYDGYYNVIANPLLWFLQHSMSTANSRTLSRREYGPSPVLLWSCSRITTSTWWPVTCVPP